MLLRGIIDRLDRLPDGAFVVVDYKTGRAPSERYEQGKLLGVDTYSLLCERVLGVRPVAVRLLYVGEGIAITCTPSDQSTRFIEQKVGAVWQTIQRANATRHLQAQARAACATGARSRRGARPSAATPTRPAASATSCASPAERPDDDACRSRAATPSSTARRPLHEPAAAEILGASRSAAAPPPGEVARALHLPAALRPTGRGLRPAGRRRHRAAPANPALDRVMYAATELGDFALIWHLVGVARGLRSDRDAADAVRLVGAPRRRVGARQRRDQVVLPPHPAGVGAAARPTRSAGPAVVELPVGPRLLGVHRRGAALARTTGAARRSTTPSAVVVATSRVT